ncbi:D-glycero-alpha-D-manno-heptose-1,7-bisphosphate 7-phosphatase [Leptospirillum ferriphilum]|jgi:D-glycero-D-manno-heptose 1,7-bisphosphate phosphatase|uniref:D-glycero-alpha-D-manno-heptose-1,7-bisphosphate 7-phosphatase n=1 Tax=Leptospirillum ferriphilum TaxID=178606 RepID=UPI003EE57159
MQEVASKPFALVLTDRDGTLIRDVPYLSRLEDIELLPGVAGAIRQLNALHIPVVVVTNQSGVARGYFTESFVQESHALLNDLLRREGAHIDLFLYCPHLSGAVKSRYDMDCTCRKPRSGMLKTALDEYGVLPGRTMMVGDSLRDVEAAENLGIMSYFISSDSRPLSSPAAHVVSSFSEAVEHFLVFQNVAITKRSSYAP